MHIYVAQILRIFGLSSIQFFSPLANITLFVIWEPSLLSWGFFPLFRIWHFYHHFCYIHDLNQVHRNLLTRVFLSPIKLMWLENDFVFLFFAIIWGQVIYCNFFRDWIMNTMIMYIDVITLIVIYRFLLVSIILNRSINCVKIDIVYKDFYSYGNGWSDIGAFKFSFSSTESVRSQP